MTDFRPGERDFAREYDMNADELARDFDKIVADLHERCPVARSTIGEGYWVLNRRSDVVAAAEDWETFVNSTGTAPDRPDGQPFLYPEESDPPIHTELRAPVEGFFRPKAIKPLEPEIRAHAEDLIAGCKAEGGGAFDAVSGFANALPGRVFFQTIAGMPVEDIPYLQATFDAGIVGPQEGRAAALGEAFGYLERFLRTRDEGEPKDDVVQAVLDVDADWDVKIGLFADLTLGGIGTTGFVLVSALRYLAEHPLEQEALRQDPSLLVAAVEEFIRFFAAAPQIGRRTTGAVEIGGVQMAEGDFVILGYGAASRDPEVFDEPERINCRRSLPNRHLAFGAGIHRCLGMHLAKTQLRIGLEAFLAEFQDFRLQPGFVRSEQIGLSRVLERLPLVVS